MKTQFLGKRDPNKIMLEDVFNFNDGVVFTTPLNEQGRIHRVFVESSAPSIRDSLIDIFFELVNKSTSSGRWSGIIPEEDLIVMTYDRLSSRTLEKNIVILTQVLYMDLAQICNLKLFNYSHISVFRNDTLTCSEFVALPSDIPNGSEEIPIVFVPKTYIS